MIFRKIKNNGNITFERITEEELAQNKQFFLDGLVFSRDVPEDEVDDLIKELIQDELEEMEEAKDNDDDEDENDDEYEVSLTLKKVNGKLRKTASIDSTLVPDQKSKSILSMLPYMDANAIKNAMNILNEDVALGTDSIWTDLLPILSKDGCDELFIEIAFDNNNKYSQTLSALAPFVSEDSLSKFVDKYIDGEIDSDSVDLNALYPYLSSKDIKRLFKYVVSKKHS